MRRVRLLDAAVREAIEAAVWYEAARSGLGSEFDAAVTAALDLLEEGLLPLVPAAGRAGERGLKRFVMRRFPYDIVVAVSENEYVVLAFAHHARRPEYWKRR
jgi:toxin ParE1/3/4